MKTRIECPECGERVSFRDAFRLESLLRPSPVKHECPACHAQMEAYVPGRIVLIILVTCMFVFLTSWSIGQFERGESLSGLLCAVLLVLLLLAFTFVDFLFVANFGKFVRLTDESLQPGGSPSPGLAKGWRRVMLAVWAIALLASAGLVGYAARNWKVPVRRAETYWSQRLAGVPGGFLGSDDGWVYTAERGFHGWTVGKVPQDEVAAARNEAVRLHIDAELAAIKAGRERPSRNLMILQYLPEEDAEDDGSAHLRELTGLSHGTAQEWSAWWKTARDTYEWPEAAEEQWARAITTRLENDKQAAGVRRFCLAQTHGVARMAWLEILFLLVLFAWVWPLGPRVCSACVRRLRRKLPVVSFVFAAAVFVLVLYVLILSPAVLFRYGSGVCSTWEGPDALTYSTLHPFSFRYRPGNTILYRQFLELVLDPTVRLARARLLGWVPSFYSVPFVAAHLYVLAAMVIGAVVAARDQKRRLGLIRARE